MISSIIQDQLVDKGYFFTETGKLTNFFDFPVSPLITIEFEDSSICTFRYAFTETVGNYLVVFTEHCGYHVFGLGMVESVVYSAK